MLSIATSFDYQVSLDRQLPLIAEAGFSHISLLVRQSLQHLNPSHFGFCYDSSHDQIEGPRPIDLVAELSSRLVAVHISDRVAAFIDHLVPGEGFIEWDSFARTLCLSRFNGPLLLEVMVTHSIKKDPRLFLQLAFERGKWLHNLISSHID